MYSSETGEHIFSLNGACIPIWFEATPQSSSSLAYIQHQGSKARVSQVLPLLTYTGSGGDWNCSNCLCVFLWWMFHLGIFHSNLVAPTSKLHSRAIGWVALVVCLPPRDGSLNTCSAWWDSNQQVKWHTNLDQSWREGVLVSYLVGRTGIPVELFRLDWKQTTICYFSYTKTWLPDNLSLWNILSELKHVLGSNSSQRRFDGSKVMLLFF